VGDVGGHPLPEFMGEKKSYGNKEKEENGKTGGNRF
jgi:hypothetical protein